MSTPGADAERSRSGPPTGNSFAGDVWTNFKRWNRKAIRNPSVVALEVTMAVLSLVVFSAVFGEAGTLALQENGYGDVGYVTFLLPAVVIQVTMASSFTSGLGVVDDLETGMFEKVVVTPMSWTAVFAGKSTAELVRIALQGLVLLVVGLAMGATVETGLAGVAGILLICLLFAVWYMALSNVLSLLTRDAEALDAAGMILLFPLLFLSSAFLPLPTMPGWIQTFGTVNPVTYGVDAVRALVLGRDVMTVVEVTRFGGVYDTLVPAVAVLGALDLLFGGLAVALLARATSATVD